jgi:hypothetical protein
MLSYLDSLLCAPAHEPIHFLLKLNSLGMALNPLLNTTHTPRPVDELLYAVGHSE